MPSAETEGLRLDRAGMRIAFDRAARSYDAAALVQREVAERLLERLDLIRCRPNTVLDAGCGTGYCLRRLRRRYRRAALIGIDLSPSMLRRARAASGWFRRPALAGGDIEALPLAERSVDMIVSNLALQWCDLGRAFAEFARVLRPGGVLVFTSFGPDTLKELRAAWQCVDSTPHVHRFIDMHDVGDALVRAGLAEAVMDVERLTVNHADVSSVLRDLKALGAHNVTAARARGLTGKGRFARFRAAYEAMAQGGRIPATYEIVYGHAWAPSIAVPGASGGVQRIPLSALRRR